MHLSDLAVRILGSLIEKGMATPQAYPLSVNALRSACNQTTGRDPVTGYDEGEVGEGLRELSGQHLVRAAYARRSSTPKYEHLVDSHLEIRPPAVALLGVLMLRGPQTLGELRQRTDRMHRFSGLGQVAKSLEGLATHPFGALVEELPRQPGQKEARWRHLLGADDAAPLAPVVGTDAGSGADGVDLVADLQEEVASLRAEVARLRALLPDDA
jgi:uncharacterized protein